MLSEFIQVKRALAFSRARAPRGPLPSQIGARTCLNPLTRWISIGASLPALAVRISRAVPRRRTHAKRPSLTASGTPATPLFSTQAKHGNRWAAVADEIPGRTGQQCAQRWRHKVNPDIRKDKWSDAEDQQVRPPPHSQHK